MPNADDRPTDRQRVPYPMLIIGLVLVTLLTVLWVVAMIAVYGSMIVSDEMITWRDMIQNGGITVLLVAVVWRLSVNIDRRRVASRKVRP